MHRHSADPRLRVTLLYAENLPGVEDEDEEECQPYVQLQIGKHSMRSSVGQGPNPEWYEQFDLVARDVTLTLAVHQKGLLGLLAGPRICVFYLPDIHALLRDDEQLLSLRAWDYPGAVLHVLVLPLHSGLQLADQQRLDAAALNERQAVAEEEAAEFAGLLREFWDAAAELQHIGRAKARLLRVEEEERQRLMAEYDLFCQGEVQDGLGILALLQEEEDIRLGIAAEATVTLVTTHRYWQAQLQETVDAAVTRQAWEDFCLAALRLLWEEFQARLAVQAEAAAEREACGEWRALQGEAWAGRQWLGQDMADVWRLTSLLEETERLQLPLAATYTAHKALLLEEHAGRREVAAAAGPGWLEVAQSCVEAEETHRRGAVELCWLEDREAVERQAAGSAETGHTQALALRQGLLAVEAEEEQLREALGQEWTHELYSPALQHCLAAEATLRLALLTQWGTTAAGQRLGWEAELAELAEARDRQRLAAEAEAEAGLLEGYCREALALGHEEEAHWAALAAEIAVVRQVVDFPLREAAARRELEEKWFCRWWEKWKRCAIFSLEVCNRARLLELYGDEVGERQALAALRARERAVAELMAEERVTRDCIGVEESATAPWLERAGLALLELAERAAEFGRWVGPCLATVAQREAEEWAPLCWAGLCERAHLQLLLEEMGERQECLQLEAGIFGCVAEASRAGVAAIHRRQREKLEAEEEAERAGLGAEWEGRAQRMRQLLLETLPLQIAITCQLVRDPLALARLKRHVRKTVVVVKDVPFSALRRQVEERFCCHLLLLIHRSLAEHEAACVEPCGGHYYPWDDKPSAGAALAVARKNGPPLADLVEVTADNYAVLLRPTAPPASCDPTPLPSLGLLFCQPVYPGVHGLSSPSLSEAWQHNKDKTRAAFIRLRKYNHRKEELLGDDLAEEFAS
eukprot:EG_transcript_1397